MINLVTVVYGDKKRKILPACVVHRFSDQFTYKLVAPRFDSRVDGVKSYDSEGVQWVRGWAGPEVDALRTVEALR